MCPYVYIGNENKENGLNSFFLEKEVFLPFSFVRLGMVLVHSPTVSCTVRPKISQMPYGFCTVGLSFCAVGYNVRLPLFLVHLVAYIVQLVYYYVQMDVET